MTHILKERLEQIVSSLCKNRKEFADKCGFTSKSVTNYLDQGVNPGCEAVVRILRGFPCVSADWLLLGEGEMLREGYELPVIEKTDDGKKRYRRSANELQSAEQTELRNDSQVLDFILKQQAMIMGELEGLKSKLK